MTDRIIFNSRGRVGIVGADGSGERSLNFGIPGQASWQFGPHFSDGRRSILFSYEGVRTWEQNVTSHLWLYDWKTERLAEIAIRDRPAPFMPVCALLPGEERMIVNPSVNGTQIVMAMDLDGSNQATLTTVEQGFTYGVALSPDGRRIAYHANYDIYVQNVDGPERTLVAGNPDRLYFGPTWSADGSRLVFLDCDPATDPGHDWADIRIADPASAEHRAATTGMRHWFGTSYGDPNTRGSGSNVPQWSPKRDVFTFTRSTTPGSQTAWLFRQDRPDTDHFNRDYHPEKAQGGTQICLVDPDAGVATPITDEEDGMWAFRTAWSPDGGRIAYCRACVGEPAGLWVMDADGTDQRFLTRGWDGRGADHPRWR